MIFGVATSAFQLEGAQDNDWTAWEAAGRLKDPAMRVGRGVGHYERWREDLDLLSDLKAKAYRLSVEWSRIEPSPGRVDDAALRHYADLVAEVRRRGILPMVSIHHFTHPRWFHAEGSWDGPRAAERFAAFTRTVAEAMKGQVDTWVTFTEPMVILLGGFVEGILPPGARSITRFARAAEGVVRAHAAARQVLREVTPGVPVTFSHNMMDFAPRRAWFPPDRAVARLGDQNYNHAFPRALTEGELELALPPLLRHRVRVEGAQKSIDALGVNYYTRVHVGVALTRTGLDYAFLDKTGRGLTDIGWEEVPESFGRVLDATRRYALPIWITENGIDDRAGTRRPRFIEEHVAELDRARARGLDVRGYLHWSLVDNFEWLEGFGPRFGLYRVDFATHARTPTPAVETFRRLATREAA